MKKILFSTFLGLFASFGLYANTIDNESFNFENSPVNFTAVSSDIFWGWCRGTFYIVEEGSYDIDNPVRKMEISYETETETDCYDWLGAQTLFLADAYPRYDVIGVGSFSN